MATSLGYKRDAVRVKALKYDGSCMPDTRKFSVDPQITSFEVLKSILTKAFDIKGSIRRSFMPAKISITPSLKFASFIHSWKKSFSIDNIESDFTVCYRVLDDYGQETYIPLLSDWDLDAAFVSAWEPCLCLRVEMKIYEEVGQEWESGSASFSWITESKIPLRLQGLIMNHVEKTVNIVRGALNFIEDVHQAQEVSSLPPRQPLTDSEFRQFLDPIGQLIRAQDFKNAIYLGGVEPSLRKVVWKHLLNVYPDGLSGKQRIEYMKTKSYEYEQLRDTWKNLGATEKVDDLAYVTNMVKKDVLRTDRVHRYYAGSDDNQNIVSLFNILTTYALNHPSVSYCQGMSDLASPLLVTMGDEAHAYICFCALMRRLSSNFLLDGIAMTKRFQHLADGLLYYDPTFYAYLKAHQADDLLFCYRWLLLEMKREFAFDDALHMLEVMWSSLPPTVALTDLPLYEVRFCSQSNFTPLSPSPRETPYAKVCALRRQTSSGTLFKINRSLDESLIAKRRYLTKLYDKSKKSNSMDDSALYNRNISKNLSPVSTASSPSSCSYQENSSSKSSLHSPLSTMSEKVNSTRHFFSTDKCNGRLVRQGSLNLSKSTGKIVKNFNEFLSLDRKSINKDKAKMTADKEQKIDTVTKVRDDNSPDDSGEYYPMTTSMTRELSRELENLDRQVFVNNNHSDENVLLDNSIEICEEADTNYKSEDIFIWENPLQYEAASEELGIDVNCNGYNPDNNSYSKDLERNTIERRDSHRRQNSAPIRRNNITANSKLPNEEVRYSDPELSSLISCRNKTLPPPWEFGGGNPFLMYLCVTLLCQHRDTVMKSAMDYNEIAMHFDKMVRKHDVIRVLNQARIMYAAYLKQYKQNYLNV